MKGLVLAGICLVFLVACCAAALRIYRGDKEYLVFLGSLLSSLVLYTVLFILLPADLGFPRRGAVEPAAAVDFLNGALVLALVFHGIWTFTYMVWTGPTVRVLLHLGRTRRRGLTPGEVLALFESGDRANVFLRRRVPKLLSGGHIIREGDGYRLSPRGRAAGRIVVRLKRTIGDLEQQ